MTFSNNSSFIPASSLGSAIGRALTVGLLLVFITGCAAVYESKYEWNEGWRQGTVMQIGSAFEIGEQQFSDCRRKASAEQLASGTFASVSYLHMSRPRRRVIPLQQGDSLFRPGDEVYVNVASCTASLVRPATGAR